MFTAGQLSGKTLPVQGVGAEALKAIIKALYTGNCQVTLQTAGQLYDAAQKLEARVGASCNACSCHRHTPVFDCDV